MAGRFVHDHLTGSRLTPDSVAQRLRRRNPPPRPLVCALTAARAAVTGGDALIERRIRHPALARVRVGAIIVRTAAAREADARPVQAAQAAARCAATRRTRAERLRTSGRRPGILGTQL